MDEPILQDPARFMGALMKESKIHIQDRPARILKIHHPKTIGKLEGFERRQRPLFAEIRFWRL